VLLLIEAPQKARSINAVIVYRGAFVGLNQGCERSVESGKDIDV